VLNPPEAVFYGLRNETGAIWLDGGARSRSIIGFDPAHVVTNAEGWPSAMRSMLRPNRSPTLTSGVFGYVGYGAGYVVDAVPRQAPTPEPEVYLGRYEGLMIWEPGTCQWTVTGPAAFQERAKELLHAPAPPTPASPKATATSVPKQVYEDKVRRILELLRAGDCYQVNLSRTVHVTSVPDPWPVGARLRARCPASMSAWIRPGPHTVVLSASPEILLRVRADLASSQPIKGTRPRGSDRESDLSLQRELETSGKDRAELAMIVDLVRNDLGKVAEAGSVQTHPRVITAHPNVHHASQWVHAKLATGNDAVDALSALFPPGSVTGAPKVRACQRIQELELEPRGVYCGTVGYIGDNGEADWSVAIRTAVWHQGRARYHVGGGIVAASNPSDEWDETRHKGTALHHAFLGTHKSSKQG
jgi:para-aminobenzoate synthetase component I